MTFTLSQTPDSANLYLYPSGASWTNFTPLYAANWQNVDDLWSSPSTTDYVYSNTHGSTATDMYTLPDHTTETGTINYVQVIAQAKSQGHAGSSNSTFGLVISDSTGTVFSSNQAPLTNTFAQYSFVTTKKSDGNTWTWAEIDHMCIGVESSSATVNDSSTVTTLRPSGAGTNTNLIIGGTSQAATNWESVDEVTADDLVTYVYSGSGQAASYLLDTYAVPNLSSICQGTINNVTLTFKYKMETTGYIKPCWYVGGAYYGTEIYVSSDNVWKTTSRATTTAPNDGGAWAWSDIDSLEIGVAIKRQTNDTVNTQLYATINYEKESNPTVRVSQCYAVVNYTPAASTVTLNDPESLSVNHNRTINRWLFPQGDYEVEDMGRSGKTLTLTGLETSSADSEMQTLKDMCHYGTHVTIAGLSDSNLNTDYMIQNFSWTDLSYGATKKYRWTLVLEEN